MRRTALLIAALLCLAACGDDDKSTTASAPDLPTPSSTSASPTSSSASPPTSQRGNRVKELGEIGGQCLAEPCTEDKLVWQFAVDKITPDIECNSGYSSPPDNGHFIGIALRVSTSPDYPVNEWFTSFTAADFSLIGPDGLTVSDVQGQAALCLESGAFTYDQIGPGQQYAGTVVIDAPVTSGTLVYTPAGATTGWEWKF